jgi:hypothetical protein
MVDFKNARDFVYANGQLWERALFAYCFQDGSLAHLHDSLRAYRNLTVATGMRWNMI